MDFDFSVEQKAMRDEMRRFLAVHSSPQRNRETLNKSLPFDRDLWSQLGRLGYLGIAISERYRGTGLGFLELCLLSEEVGRELTPVPFLASIAYAATAIERFGSGEQKELWLPQLASGDLIGTVALAEQTGPLARESVSATVNQGRISGKKVAVPYGCEADIAIVVARGDIDPCSPTLFIVDLAQSGVSRQSIPSLDLSQPQAVIDFDGAACERLGRCTTWSSVDELIDIAAVLVAFNQIGGADRTLELARDFALERHAFGRPIGSFQAIKHKMADMYMAGVLARSSAYYGAWALDTNAAELPLAAAIARLSATEAFQLCSRECIQVHGGMGFTWEMDAHLYYRRSNHLAVALGGPISWGERMIDALAGVSQAKEIYSATSNTKEAVT